MKLTNSKLCPTCARKNSLSQRFMTCRFKVHLQTYHHNFVSLCNAIPLFYHFYAYRLAAFANCLIQT